MHFFTFPPPSPFTFFSFPAFIFPPLTDSVSDFLALPPYLPAPSPFAPFTPSLLPSLLPSLCIVEGGGPVTSFGSLLEPLTSGTACSPSSRSADDTSTHTFLSAPTGRPGHRRALRFLTRQRSFSSFRLRVYRCACRAAHSSFCCFLFFLLPCSDCADSQECQHAAQRRCSRRSTAFSF